MSDRIEREELVHPVAQRTGQDVGTVDKVVDAFLDEIYQAIIINPFARISQFLADVIDWRFWHDWFHEAVIAGTYNFVSNIALDKYADQRGIDAIANGLGAWTQSLSATMRKVQNGFVRSYALSVLLGVVLIVGYLILK